jgi:L-alanine-DL-glutamate epimerase-like enolase superfamily enzyme
MQNDIVSDPIVMEDGFIAVRDAPGLGITIDEAAVRRYLFE